MIVPGNRLMFFTAAALPVAAAATFIPEAVPIAAVLFGLLTLAAGVDSFLAIGSLRDIKVQLPEIIRLSKDREGAIPFIIENPTSQPLVLRLGLPFPQEITPQTENLQVILPEESVRSQVAWPCRPTARGAFHLAACHLEGASPLGFWLARTRIPLRSEIRVYPNLSTEKRQMAALFLNRGSFGTHTQRVVGQGRDFEKLRDYVQGDSYDQIHWKATAKRGHPVTKVFQIERTQEVYVAIDHSRLSTQPAGNETVLERFLASSLVLGLAAERQGDHFGLLAFSDRIGRFLRASNGRNHYNACRDALYTLKTEAVNPSFEEIAAFIRIRLRKRALIIFLTSLTDPVLAEQFTKNIELISRQHLVLTAVVQTGQTAPLFQGDPARNLDDLYRHLGGHLAWQHLRELARELQHHGSKLLQFPHERLSAQLVAEYMAIKQRQIL
ncbi:MAG: DUF58 domain-containing protein [Verrucomicrobiae bacterium]|nr:DUF58 domain-containing protein [Verrucomicrobiae bacterium]